MNLDKLRKGLLYGQNDAAWKNDDDESLLRWERKYYEEKKKDPNFVPSAGFVKVEQPRQSLFAKSRPSTAGKNAAEEGKPTILLGSVIERRFDTPKMSYNEEPMDTTDEEPKSLFARALLSDASGECDPKMPRLSGGTMSDAFKKPVQINDEPAAPRLTKEEINHRLNKYPNDKSIDDLIKDVQQENDEKLSGMSHDEILKARNELIKGMDVKLLSAIKRNVDLRMSTAQDRPSTKSSTMDEQPSIPYQLPATNPAAELLEQSREHNWVNFDVVENEKLDWMQEISLKTKTLKPDEKFEARFDFKGVLLPYTITGSEDDFAKAMHRNRELFFHTDEPDRAGYTMQELFRLARSDVLQQRTAALGAIGGILNIYNQGFYDRVFDVPITKIFFLLRYAFDDNMPSMVETVSSALAALFYNDTDETLLDYMFDNPNCVWQPLLIVGEEGNKADEEDPTAVASVQKQFQTLNVGERKLAKGNNMIETTVENEKFEDFDMNDFELAEIDLVKCALRTDILQRIWFILEHLRPNSSTVTSCLKILIRFARSGPEAASEIANFDLLVKALCKNFIPRVADMIPLSLFYMNPQPLCIKLFRILVSQSTAMADRLALNGLLETVIDHMHPLQNITAKVCKVQTEIMRLLRVALIVGSSKKLNAYFVKQLYIMIQWHNNYKTYAASTPLFQRMHATSLIALICSYKGDNHTEFSGHVDALYDFCCSTFHQAKKEGVTTISQVNLLNGCLDIVLMCIHRHQANRMSPFINVHLKDFIDSNNFLAMIERLSSTSLVLSPYFDRSQVHEALPNLGAILMHETGPSLIMSEQYATHMLKTLFYLLDSCDTLVTSKTRSVLLRPAVTTAVSKYISKVGRRLNRSLTANFFAKRELQFIYQIIMGQSIKVPLKPEDVLRCAYNLASCLGTDSVSQLTDLFRDVLFNPEYINMPEATLNTWADCYISLVIPSMIFVSEEDLTLNLPYRSPGVLPPDWIFSFIKDILKEHLENLKPSPQQTVDATSEVGEVDICLMTYEYWRLLELASPDLRICSPTEVLMYLMITFLGKERAFFDTAVSTVVEQRVKKFFEEYKHYQFQLDVVFNGKCSFENLYILFTNHFASDSYGNNLFASLVMVPLAMKYDVKYRKMLWSEYAAALTYIRCPKEMLMGGFEAYITPVETDMSLISAYSTLIKTGEVVEGTVPYEIAMHHLKHSLLSQKKKQQKN